MSRPRLVGAGLLLNLGLGLAFLLLSGSATEAGSRLAGSARTCVAAVERSFLTDAADLEVTGEGTPVLTVRGTLRQTNGVEVGVDVRCRVAYDGDSVDLVGLDGLDPATARGPR